MNEQRQQEYFNLIKNLLNCPSGQEPEILAAKQELVDVGLLQTVEEVAKLFSQQGDEKTGNWLQGLAMQLGEALNLDPIVDLQSLSEEKIQTYLQFLMQILEVTESSWGDAQVIYPLLAKNIDKLDGVLAEILRQWGTNELGEAEADEAKDLAAVIVLFSNRISKFPLGNKASNMEFAITGYKVALTVYTQQAFPQDWAMTQNNLAGAYPNRIRGEQANNLELAIACYQEALKVYTFDAFPYEWARTQNNLAVVYSERIRRERADNLELAITCYQEALKGYTFDAFPVEWARTQNNLGNAYRQRIRGKRADNLELEIACCQEALKIYTFDAFPVEWARTQHDIANAYLHRVKEERADNLERAITCYQKALKIYTFDTFAYEWAVTQNNLAIAYLHRIRGERADNLELAITCCQEALKVRTFDVFPVDWAGTQNNLANAYLHRIRGERADNLERAIACYQEAMKVYIFDAFPIDWARTQNNFAVVYRQRIRGERADNLELAIAYYQEALKIYIFDAFPVDWAMVQNNLANAYRERIREEQAQNLELAIACCREALKVRTFDAFPYEWAITQNNLGNVYRERIRGERAQNLELAIACYQEALKVRTFDTVPYEWAQTQHDIAMAYGERIRGERAQNLELVIAYCQEALKVTTFDAFPYEWAMTQNILANGYLNRIRGERTENLEQAIACYQESLKIMTFDAFPQYWATAHNNLTAAYFKRIRGERTENLEQAITCCQEALKVYTFDAFPQYWAIVQNNLAVIYLHRIRGKRTENLQQAITCCQEALKVYTFDAFPQNHAETLFNLGMAFQNTNQLILAYKTFESAIATVESLREEIVSGEEIKRKQAEEWNKLYSSMVEVCLELGNTTAAIEYVERSKTRNLVEQILSRDLKTIFPADVVTQLETYRDEIAIGQYQIQNCKAENPTIVAQHLLQLRQQRNELQNRYLPVGYSFKFDSFQATLNERTAIIEWYILDDKFLAFIIKSTGEVTVWQSQPEDREMLGNWVIQYLQNYYEQKDQWLNRLGENLKKLASILHIDEILAQIPNHCEQLVLIPHRFLHLFPLHALPVTSQSSENSRCFLNLFAGGVSYAPSCQLLQQVQQRERSYFQSLFAIQNPTEDLNYTDLEVQVIQNYFNTANVLKKSAATLTAINNSDLNTYHCAHFSCHGYFNLTNPSKSALILANAPVADALSKPNAERYLNLRLGEIHDLDKCLTLDKIFTLKLENCRLITLSACETGLIDFNNTSDEYIGLPSGFLLAGSPSVVSSLWSVNDVSTSFLMIKFYEKLVKLDNLQAGDVAIALNQAQQWLQNLTIEEFEKLLERYKSQIEQTLAPLRKGQRLRFEESLKLTRQRQPLPFANPYYWAAFIASGL